MLYFAAMGPENRETDRVSMLGELQGEIMVFQPMRITEIGASGATIETRLQLHLNSLHDIRIVLGDGPVVLKGRVVHSSISDVDQDVVTYRTGLEFIEPSDGVTTAIVAFLEQIATRRSGA